MTQNPTKDRYQAIITAGHDCPNLARHLAFETDMSVEAATKIMAINREETPGSLAAAGERAWSRFVH